MSSGRYDAETRAKAVRLYKDHVADYPSPWAAMKVISSRLGMTAETLRKWVRQAEVDAGQVAGVSTESMHRSCGNCGANARELEQTIDVLKAARQLSSRGSATRYTR